MKKRGFTLVELLVVIGIIAVLVSILLPSLNKARESAKSVLCMSNLRQVGQAFMIYGTSSKVYPKHMMVSTDPAYSPNAYGGQKYWFNAVMPGTETGRGVAALYCPNDAFLDEHSDLLDRSRFFSVSYGYSAGIAGLEGTSSAGLITADPTNFAIMAKPSRYGMKRAAERVLAAETATGGRLVTNVKGNGGASWGLLQFQRDPWNYGQIVIRHGKDTANVLWADGHVTPVASPLKTWLGFYEPTCLGRSNSISTAGYRHAWGL